MGGIPPPYISEHKHSYSDGENEECQCHEAGSVHTCKTIRTHFGNLGL